jgi:hypothetical protein
MLRKLVLQEVLLKELLPKPDGNCHRERPQTAGGKGQVGLEQSFELEKGLVVEDNMINPVQADTGLAQAVPDRVTREGGIVLLAREPLLLGRGHDPAVLDQGGGAVVVKGGDPQNEHAASSLRRACR